MSGAIRFLRSQGHTTLAYVSQPVNASPFICSESVREQGFVRAAEECGYGDGDVIVIPRCVMRVNRWNRICIRASSRSC